VPWRLERALYWLVQQDWQQELHTTGYLPVGHLHRILESNFDHSLGFGGHGQEGIIASFCNLRRAIKKGEGRFWALTSFILTGVGYATSGKVGREIAISVRAFLKDTVKVLKSIHELGDNILISLCVGLPRGGRKDTQGP
jgi:hypothetical protein